MLIPTVAAFILFLSVIPFPAQVADLVGMEVAACKCPLNGLNRRFWALCESGNPCSGATWIAPEYQVLTGYRSVNLHSFKLSSGAGGRRWPLVAAGGGLDRFPRGQGLLRNVEPGVRATG